MKRIIFLMLAAIFLVGCGNQSDSTAPNSSTQPTDNSTLSTTQSPSTEPEDIPVTPDKLIALTFDDGPNKKNTMNDVLDILAQYDVKATFFLIGNLINVDTRDVVEQAYTAGHEIASHSFSHTKMGQMNEAEILEEYQKVQDLVKAITGEEPKLFRPPFLDVSDTMRSTIPAPFIEGYSPGDYEADVTAETIAARVLNNAQDGSVILLHVSQGYDQTEQSLHIIIPELKKQGYEFVTVSELFVRMGVTPENGASYDVIVQPSE